MDESLQRRLVGAVVLMALAFGFSLLLPEPQRRADGGTGGTVTYDLRTGERLAEEPARPSQEPPAAASAAPRPTLKVDETLSEPRDDWYVQIGSFESQANATGVLKKLFGLGLPAIIQSRPAGKKLWYRVRVGPYGEEKAAQQALALIRKNGYPLAALVRPDTMPGGGQN